MAILEVRDVVLRFGGLTALAGVSFSVEEGEILALIGPNGAGKTSLFNVVAGKYRPQQGRVLFLGKDITGLKPNAICRLGIARTYQLVRPFTGMSVLENVLVGAFFGQRDGVSASQAEHHALELLRLVHLAERAGSPAGSLTIAERKRLELARALATRPRLLLLDEAVAGLTPTETGRLLKTLSGIRESGVTLLFIEHVMKAVMSLSDRIVVLHHGEKIAEGRPEAIARDDAVIQAYLGERVNP